MIYLTDREGERIHRKSSHLLVPSQVPATSLGVVGGDTGYWNTVQLFHIHDRNPISGARARARDQTQALHCGMQGPNQHLSLGQTPNPFLLP